jgi:DNA (cytosine-5)-methyltransferase 1
VDAGPQAALAFDAGPLEPYRTAWDALGDVDEGADDSLRVSGKWADLLPSIPEGENYLHHTERGGGLPLFGWRRRYWSFLLKLAKDRPSWTLTAQPGSAIGPFHWRNRRLSMRELCRLQTFPTDYVLVGGRTAIQRQAGNAVPSLLTEMLGREIRQQLLDGHRFRKPLTLLPSRRGTPPPPERPSPVPRKYHALAGIHAAHPGTGLGYGAARRAASSAVVSP